MADGLRISPPKSAGLLNVQRAGVRSPLTPVGSPDVRSRTAESLHKTTSTGNTVDIMILPRTADENERERRPKTADLVAPPGVEEKPPVKDGTITAPIDAAKTEFQGMTGSEFLANLPKGVSACPFLEHGCHKVGNEMDVKLHVRDDRMLHLVLLCRAVSEVRRVRIQHFLELPRTLLQLDNTLYPALVAERKYGDQCIFRIKNINMTILNARNAANQLLFSQPFETHRYGYKMTLIIAPFGDADSARQYLSVYVTIVKGDFDAVLRWPFIYPITFIAHAANSRDNLTKKLVPNPTPENDAFLGRPKTRNAAFGFQRFCKLIDIDKYTVSGDFFLSVHVDLSSMETDRTPRKSSDQL